MRTVYKLLAALFALAFVTTHAFAAPTRFTATVSGKGPDVILVPGLASSAESLAPTARRLSATHRVHLIQVAGFAGAPAAGNAAGSVLAPLVEEIAVYIAEGKLKAPAVIGHSMGGEAALMLAARHPQAVGRVLVIDALPFFPLTMNPKATAAEMEPMAAMFRDRALAMDEAGWKASETTLMARLVKTDAARDAVTQAAIASDRSVAARAAYDLMTTDLRPELAKIAAPVTVLYAYDAAFGMPGTAVDGLFKAAYAGTPRLTLTRVDGSFHFIMLDQPATFDAAVDAFLK